MTVRGEGEGGGGGGGTGMARALRAHSAPGAGAECSGRRGALRAGAECSGRRGALRAGGGLLLGGLAGFGGPGGPGGGPAGAISEQLHQFGSREFPDGLKNRYFLVAHGESMLELEAMPDGSRGVLLSNPGFKYDFGYGITDSGRDQMVEAARVMEDELGFAGGWIYTSNFQRAFQSALQLREGLGVPFSQFRTEFSGLLDPRKVGALDGGPRARMQDVYQADRKDPFSTPPPVEASLQPSASVESVMDVNRRVLEAITRLERSYYGDDIALCSHCSTLSIYMAAMMGTKLGDHQRDWPFQHGQVRVYDERLLRRGGEPPTCLPAAGIGGGGPACTVDPLYEV